MPDSTVPIIIYSTLGLILLVAAVVGIFRYCKKKQEERPTQQNNINRNNNNNNTNNVNNVNGSQRNPYRPQTHPLQQFYQTQTEHPPSNNPPHPLNKITQTQQQSQRQFQKLSSTQKQVISTESIALQCGICFTEEPPTLHLSCGHSFHRKCLSDWINMNQTCPLCRRDIHAGDMVDCYCQKCRALMQQEHIQDIFEGQKCGIDLCHDCRSNL